MTSYRDRIKSSDAAASSYNTRKASKHRGEVELVERALADLTQVETFLDAPCGTGRFVILLSQHGYRTTGLDLGEAALAHARGNCEAAGITAADLVQGDLEALDFTAASFDAILCFRLFHHLPDPAVRARVAGELCRVARRYVLLSWFDPRSFTSIKRSLRYRLTGKRSRQHATPLAEVAGYFAAHGFALRHNYARAPFLHTLNLALFERAS